MIIFGSDHLQANDHKGKLFNRFVRSEDEAINSWYREGVGAYEDRDCGNSDQGYSQAHVDVIVIKECFDVGPSITRTLCTD
jgi:hypothetical protein